MATKFDLYTQLSLIHPAVKNLAMRRGATFEYVYTKLTPNAVKTQIVQATYLLKQDALLQHFDLFAYYQPTTDTVAQAGKTYFCKEALFGSLLGYKMVALNLSTGTAVPTGSYVPASLDITSPSGTASTWVKSFDKHFYPTDAGLVFHLNPEESALFEASTPQNPSEPPIIFQISITYDSSNTAYMQGRDITALEEQPRILVLDGLYSDVI